jgi:electron transfer flavoprotein alpha subunit
VTRVLVIAEHDDAGLAPATRNVIGAATILAPAALDVAVLSRDTQALAAQAAGIAGVTRVLCIERAENSPCLAAVWAPQLAALAAAYTHVLAPATTFGKDLLPRLAALCGVSALSDIVDIEGPHRFARPVYAGNAIATVAADPARTLCATVRPTAFAPAASGGPAAVESLRLPIALPLHTRFVARSSGRQAGPELQTARRVVAGGRGFGTAENFALVTKLAALLDAAVGASRAAVDAGWIGNDRQVGQTGKIVAPDLYVALGISGAIQHLTGIKDAGTIVAINRDADAPICKLADIVLIADLMTAVPELIAALGACTRATDP